MKKTTCRERLPLGASEAGGKWCEECIDATLAAVNGGMVIIIKNINTNKARQWKQEKNINK